MVISYFQRVEKGVTPIEVERPGASVVRKLTGEGANHHDLGNTNYAFVVKSQKLSEWAWDLILTARD
ncbi:MAG: hypothetical protein QW760_02165 [Thermofilaceae archaeon]